MSIRVDVVIVPVAVLLPFQHSHCLRVDVVPYSILSSECRQPTLSRDAGTGKEHHLWTVVNGWIDLVVFSSGI